MRIGLDIDNVIADFDKSILEEFFILDKSKRNKGIINPNAHHIVVGMFDWSDEEIHDFFCNNMQRIAEHLTPIKDAKKYMDKLLSDGNELYLISHRSYPHYSKPFELTKKWLMDNDIKYTKLILSLSTNKSKECIENKIDIFVDDVVSNCMQLEASGIKCFLMETQYNVNQKKILSVVKDWEDLYRKVGDIKNEKGKYYSRH